MANYATLKAAIQNVVKTNGNNEITGALLQQTLLTMVSSLGAGYQYMGVATPATNPGTPDQNVFYLASTAGTYANIGGLVLADGEIAILKYNGTWSKDSIGAALLENVNQLRQNLYGIDEVLLDNITTQPSKVYITSDMVSPGDTLVFDLESLNNLQGILRAEKTGYVFDANIDVAAGQTARVTYIVPQDFLRIYTQSIANPMKVTCTRVLAGDIDRINEQLAQTLPLSSLAQTTGNDQSKIMSQKAATSYGDSPFAVVVPDALNGIVTFRFGLLKNDPLTLDKYTSFRISYIYMGGAWNIAMQLQASVDGVAWVNYDGIDRLATAAPSPLPVIETLKSNTGRFEVVVNWSKMGNISASSLNAILKKDAPNYFLKALQDQINVIVDRENIGVNDYELKDRTKHIIKVDASGNGDYTTIAAAYAAITDSSFDNQYEVVIYPGTYHEYNLIPPKFVHTHGLIPNSVIVTSEGVSSTLPVFDQRVPCKLSNMMIVSGTGYCVHQDQTTLHGIALVNENLHCKKVYGADVSNFAWRRLTNPSVLGIGASLYGAKFVWNNCIFENGWAASHSVGGDETTPANQHLIYHNCKLVNAMLNIQAVGNSAQQGNYVCEVDGLITEFGRPSAVCVPRARNAGDTTYQFPWQIIGGGNKNFVVLTLNIYDTSIDDVWPNINTADIILVQMANGVSVSKGQFVDVSGNVCNASTPVKDVIGMAVEDGAAGASVRVHIGSFALDNSGVSGAFPNVANDGEYGIGADGRLSANATDIIGVVKYNNFYRINP